MLRRMTIFALGITPYPDESLVGFLFRLARRRRLPTIRPLMFASGIVNLTTQPSGQQLRALAEVASLEVGQLEAITYGPPNPAIGLFRGIPLPSNVFDGRGNAQRRVPRLPAGGAVASRDLGPDVHLCLPGSPQGARGNL